MTITLPTPISEWVNRRAKASGSTPQEIVCSLLNTEMQQQANDAILREAMADEDGIEATEEQVIARKSQLETMLRKTLEGPPAELWTKNDIEILKQRIRERTGQSQGE